MMNYVPLPNNGRIVSHRSGTYHYTGDAEAFSQLQALLRRWRDSAPELLSGNRSNSAWNERNAMCRRLRDGGKENWARVQAHALADLGEGERQ